MPLRRHFLYSIRVPARARTALLYVALLLTGAAALVYQVAWGRMLRAVFGVGDLAVATVLAAYFAGLGLGSLLGGRLVRRLARPALGYAALELFVGLYAITSLGVVPLVRDAFRQFAQDASFEVVSLLRLGLAMLVLLPPTLAMGASMPVALAAASGGEGGVPVRSALAYAVNTLGAMCGAAAAGFWLIPGIGLRASIIAAAAGSAAAAAIVFMTWRGARFVASTADAAAPVAASVEPDAGGARPALAAVLVFLGGFVALASEVLWTRVLGLVVHGTTQAFAAMLTTFLLGIALGSALATRLLGDLRRPALAYATTQIAVAAGTLLAMVVTAESPRTIALLTGSQDLAPTTTPVLLAVALGTLLPLAIATGATIPIAWRIATGRGAPLGAAAAHVLAANTLGGLVGALATALLLVPALGIDLTAIMLVGLALLGAAIAARADAGAGVRWRSLALVVPAAAYALVMLLEPSVHLPYLLRAREAPVAAVFDGPRDPEWMKPIVFLQEGRNSTVTVQRLGTASLRLLNDGRPESGLSVEPPGFGKELILQGTLPTLRAGRIDRAAVVGLGAGHTVTTLLAGGFRRVDAIELEPAVVDAARFMHRAMSRPFPLDDPRARTIVDDGRARLSITPAGTYDAVVSQPSHPWLASSSALYTREFLVDVRRVLRPGGVFVLWVNRFRMDVRHLRDVIATTTGVFPSVEAYATDDDLIVLAARDRRRPTATEVDRRLAAAPALRKILSARQLWPLAAIAAHAEMDDAAARAFGRGARVITDDRPTLEYELSHLPQASTVPNAKLDRALAGLPWAPPSAEAVDSALEQYLARVDAIGERPRAMDRVDARLRDSALPLRISAVIEGALAAARGDEPRAKAWFARSDAPQAIVRRARLFDQDGEAAELLSAVEAAPDVPEEARRLAASAAVELGRWELAQAWAGRLSDQDAALGRAIDALARARAAGPCASVPPEVPVRVIREDPRLLWAAAACAIEARDEDRAHGYVSAAEGTARARAVALAERGSRLAESGNRRAAEQALRRALRWNPASGPAAATLAKLQVAAGDRPGAQRTLEGALDAAHGLPRTTEQLLGAAAALQIRIAGAATGADRSATSTAGTGGQGAGRAEVAGGGAGE